MNKADLENARRILMDEYPNLATFLSALKDRYIERPGLNTVAVDRGLRVYYDPALTWSEKEIVGAYIHEIGHINRNHFGRYEQHGCDNFQRWNAAGDLEINDDQPPEWPLPQGYGITPQMYGMPDEKIAEWYYDRLGGNTPEPEPGEGDPGPGEGEGEGSGGEGEGESGDGEGSGQGEGESGGSGSGSGGSGPENGSEAGSGGSGQGDPSKQDWSKNEGDCGSAAGGDKRDYELPDDDEQHPAYDDRTVEQIVEETKGATARELADPTNKPRPGEGRGSNMANAIFGDAVQEVYDKAWDRRLHSDISKYLKKGGKGFQRPNRRLYDRKIIYTGTAQVPPKVGIVVDVSGSMGDVCARKAFSVVNKFRGWAVDVQVVACDDDAVPVRPGQEVYAGGGTRMGEGIRWLSEHGGCDVCFVITDCEQGPGGWGDKPKFPVVAYSFAYRASVDWVETVMMPPLDESVAYPEEIVGQTYGRNNW